MKKILLLLYILLMAQAISPETDTAGEQFDNKFVEHHLSNSGIWHPFPFMDVPFGKTLFTIGNIEIKLSLHLLMMFIAFTVLVVSMVFFLKKDATKPPRGFHNLVEMLIVFVRDELCVPQMGRKEADRFLPFSLTLFFYILTLNILGLFPIFAPATSNVNITAGLATITLAVMVVSGLKRHGPVGFIKLFMPPGVPKVLYVVLLPLELFGLFTKPLALTMRLFGNMLGGHVAISAVLSLIVTFGYFGLPALGMGLLLDLIDVLAVFLQAMIFTMLSAVYIGSMLNAHH